MTDTLKQCLNWINRQPELQDGWISYAARAMLLRLWKERDDEVAALNARIKLLEDGTVLPVVQLHDGDKLIINAALPLTADQRRALSDALTAALNDPSRRAIVLDRCSLFVLRDAQGTAALLESVDEICLDGQANKAI